MKLGISCGIQEIKMIPGLRRLLSEKKIDYVELYLPMDLRFTDLMAWKRVFSDRTKEWFVHAPHLANADTSDSAFRLAEEIKDLLEAKAVIFDPGVNAPTYTIFNIKKGFLPENMPFFTSLGDRGNFALPHEHGGEFCLDFMHAILTAKYGGIEPKKLVEAFLKKNPKHFHLSDSSSYDLDDHCLLGKGVLANELNWLSEILQYKTKEDIEITIETGHEGDHLDNIEKDLAAFKRLCTFYEPIRV